MPPAGTCSLFGTDLASARASVVDRMDASFLKIVYLKSRLDGFVTPLLSAVTRYKMMPGQKLWQEGCLV